MDSFKKFKGNLPSKDKFCSSLTDHQISDKKYEHVVSVWKLFDMKNIKDDHDLYLECNVLSLADVF